MDNVEQSQSPGEAEALPPLAKMAPSPVGGNPSPFSPPHLPGPTQPPPGYPVFAPPVAAPYGVPIGAPPAYLEPVAQRPARPIVLTVIGIASIVFAVLGIFGAIVTAIGATGFMITADTIAAVQVKMATQAAAPTLPNAPVAAVKASPGPNGLDEQDRQAVIVALSRLEPIPDNRREQLDLVLTLAGKAMFPKAGGLADADAIEQMVRDHGEKFSEKPDAQGTSFFVTEGGQLDLYDDHAVFRPKDGSDRVRVAANPPPPVGLTAEEVEGVISQVQISTKNALNAQQQAALRVMLADPNQDLLSPNRLSSPIASFATDGGNVTIRFTGGNPITLGSQGESLSPGAAPPPRVSRPLFIGIMAIAAATLGLAIYLLVAGVWMLRGKFAAAGRALNRYAWMKVIVTAALIALASWLYSDFSTRLTDVLDAAAGASNVTPTVPVWAPRLIGLGALGFLYPLALVILLRLPVVKTALASKPNRHLY